MSCPCTKPIPDPAPTPLPTPGAAPVLGLQPGECAQIGPVMVCAIGSPGDMQTRLRPQDPKEKPKRNQWD